MASSILKRVHPATEQAISELANREGRTFVAQLDRVVDAGFAALGEPIPDRSEPEQPTPAKPRRHARAARTPATA